MLFSILLCFLPNLAAEEFVPKHASIQQNGQTIEVKDLSGLPSFNADYNPQDDGCMELLYLAPAGCQR